MVVIHGMNTRGPWQEELSWRIANKFRYHAPVLIYKYGWATIDVLAPLIQQRLAKELGRKIRSAVQYAARSGIADPPDLVAHSFGTLLFSLLLRDPEFDALKFGRVITVGSIIRPDFKWAPHLQSGRIEAVLNHAAAKDIPVRVAEYIIPGSGPSGYGGYLDPIITNVISEEFAHSSALEEQYQSVLLANGGLWDRFLRYPQAGFHDAEQFRPTKWKRASVVLRCLGRLAGIAIFALAIIPSGIRRLLDK
jgi:pimeloyl-ACP methyl ester carboxylesterase